MCICRREIIDSIFVCRNFSWWRKRFSFVVQYVLHRGCMTERKITAKCKSKMYWRIRVNCWTICIWCSGWSLYRTSNQSMRILHCFVFVIHLCVQEETLTCMQMQRKIVRISLVDCNRCVCGHVMLRTQWKSICIFAIACGVYRQKTFHANVSVDACALHVNTNGTTKK